jgi:NAD(P)-dependent dehydrogenase (short-subunit alcohol dehydrogenase family)
MSNTRKTAIVTGASQGIGTGVVKAFVERGYNVVANSRKVTQSTEVAASDRIALVDGDVGEPTNAAKIVETALSHFRSIEVLVNNAGIFFTRPFTDYTAEDFQALVSTNLAGFLTWRWSMPRTASASTPSRPAPSIRRFTGGTPKEVMESLSPMGRPSTVKDIAGAVLFLTDAATVTGHILYIDGGAHIGRR